tara:strand:+ start:406 stop:555 length:150 start_codon:yes stop_codon:yes gene_type:complete
MQQTEATYYPATAVSVELALAWPEKHQALPAQAVCRMKVMNGRYENIEP